MEYPEFLKKGNTIGLVAPSFGCSFEPYLSRYEYALNQFKEMGYYVNEGPNCRLGEGVGISNIPRECARELEEYYVNPDIDFVLSCGGGELMCETISELDLNPIRNSRPKWYMGYSDNTNFSFLSATILDRAALYGPCASNFGRHPWHESINDALDVITGRNLVVHNYDKYEIESPSDEEHPTEAYNCTEKVDIKCYVMSTGNNYVNDIMFTDNKNVNDVMLIDNNNVNEFMSTNNENVNDVTLTDMNYVNKVMLTDSVSIEGRLLGGCLDILTNIAGTRYDYVNRFNQKYRDDGVIWFLEACDLNVFDIRRALWHLDEAGWFNNAKAFIFGRPRCGESMFNLDEVGACLKHTLMKHNVPVIMGADIGHVPPMMTLITGAYSKVDFNNGHLVIDMGYEL